MSHCIGIDLTATAIRLVQVARRRGRLSVLGTYAKPLGSSGLPANAGAIRMLLSDIIQEAGFKTSANLAVGLSYEKVFFQSFRTDLATQEDLRRLLRFELEDDFPVPFDDLIVDVCGRRDTRDRGHEYLAAAVARRELDPWIQAFEASGWKCSVLSTDVCALEALTRLTQPPEEDTTSVLLHADGHRAILGLRQDGALIHARHWSCMGDAETIAPALAHDLELTLRSRSRYRHPSQAKVLLSGPDSLVGELSERLSQATGREVGQIRPSSMIQRSHAAQLDGGFAIALGLALLGLHPVDNQFNLLHADPDRLDRAAKSGTKRAALVSAILLAVIAGLLGFRTLRELTTLRAQHTRLGREIRTIFVEALPEEKKIVNELAQMTDHLETVRKQRDALAAAMGERIHPLRILQVLSETLASGNGIRISSFVLTRETIHVAGVGDSFESIEQLLETLRRVPQFSSVELEDVGSNRGSERPGFRLLISVKAG